MPFIIEFGATAKRIFGVNSLDYNTWDAAWKLILIVAGADGEVSKKEQDVIIDLARTTGGTDELIEILERFDFRKARIEDYLPNVDQKTRHILLYCALLAARADGLLEAERKKAYEMASLMNIDPVISQTIEQLLDLEDQVNSLRHILFLNPDNFLNKN